MPFPQAVLVLGACLGFAGTMSAHAGTLEAVRARGVLVCGVNVGVQEFSTPDSKGICHGLDVDYCRTLAAATLGDPDKIKYVSTSCLNRFVAIQSGEVDVLARNVTITMTRETNLGLVGVAVDFYDGQGFMVPGKMNTDSAKKLDGATVCVLSGSTSEVNLADFTRRRGIKIEPILLDRMDTIASAYQSGRCDAMTIDASQLAVLRVSKMQDPAAQVILPERISKEPLGPFVC